MTDVRLLFNLVSSLEVIILKFAFPGKFLQLYRNLSSYHYYDFCPFTAFISFPIFSLSILLTILFCVIKSPWRNVAKCCSYLKHISAKLHVILYKEKL